MIVLGMDTATSSTAVALRLADGATLERRDDPALGDHPGHATRLLRMAGELLAESGTDFSEIGLLAVGSGPGTFTGLRVGLATARGLAQSLGISLTPVSSLRALASAALADDTSAAPCDGVLAVIDARRGEVFIGGYGRQGEALSSPRAVRPEDLGGVLSELPSTSARLAIGDGAVRYREQLESRGLHVPDDESPLHRVSASRICELALAAEMPTPQSYQQVLPDYLRRPDAELTLEAAKR
jgi:tRNA threonylcarbamoyladenosine biosynthesis protein TsaB